MVLRPRNNTASRVAARSGFTLLEVLQGVVLVLVLIVIIHFVVKFW